MKNGSLRFCLVKGPRKTWLCNPGMAKTPKFSFGSQFSIGIRTVVAAALAKPTACLKTDTLSPLAGWLCIFLGHSIDSSFEPSTLMVHQYSYFPVSGSFTEIVDRFALVTSIICWPRENFCTIVSVSWSSTVLVGTVGWIHWDIVLLVNLTKNFKICSWPYLAARFIFACVKSIKYSSEGISFSLKILSRIKTNSCSIWLSWFISRATVIQYFWTSMLWLSNEMSSNLNFFNKNIGFCMIFFQDEFTNRQFSKLFLSRSLSISSDMFCSPGIFVNSSNFDAALITFFLTATFLTCSSSDWSEWVNFIFTEKWLEFPETEVDTSLDSSDFLDLFIEWSSSTFGSRALLGISIFWNPEIFSMTLIQKSNINWRTHTTLAKILLQF